MSPAEANIARAIWPQHMPAEACCEGCRTGTADCDVNPLKPRQTMEERRAAAVEWLGNRHLLRGGAYRR